MDKKPENERMGPVDYVLALIFGVIIISIAAQVFFRYVFNNSLSWSEELAAYLFTWLIFIGAALAIRDKAHISVPFFLNLLPAFLRTALKRIHFVLIFLVFILVTFLGFELVVRTSGMKSPAMQLPLNLVYYSALPVAGLITLFYMSRFFLNYLRKKHSENNLKMQDNNESGNCCGKKSE